ncbi:hypothetical protein NBRC116597_35910 [Phaeobacter sp. NW0010-22]
MTFSGEYVGTAATGSGSGARERPQLETMAKANTAHTTKRIINNPKPMFACSGYPLILGPRQHRIP